MSQQPQILVVDDDEAVRGIIAACAAKAGYRVAQSEDAAGLRAWLDHGGIDLILLDVTLPDGNGFALARDLRARYDVGIIMVTEKGAPDERALGLEIGADDYLAKPVYPRELLARIKNVLERRAGSRPQADGHRLDFADWTMDGRERVVADRHGRALDLTPAEFDLLSILVERAGRMQSRDQLMEALGSAETEAGPRSVDILISRLRKKLLDPALIETCRGHGYRFTAKITRAT
ncbi:DNA-binding response regulator [Paramagnetospirillum kuznetsovii]|uniref:DNA-binding response regulator n=1 Tax=Paramagnetospirillum kuznetsovii TaxID=2053833 RepID=A0A364NUB9_9PROT|nr:response regulator transcription factor [Paramagnetospirillum kuznetsovii]RAU20477.1 DNA-binding response regulator [Paramagnetospirillum kuznetsovii]